MNSAFSCDNTHLVTLRTVSAPTIYGSRSARIHTPRSSHALILHRFSIDCRFSTELMETCNATV